MANLSNQTRKARFFTFLEKKNILSKVVNEQKKYRQFFCIWSIVFKKLTEKCYQVKLLNISMNYTINFLEGLKTCQGNSILF